MYIQANAQIQEGRVGYTPTYKWTCNDCKQYREGEGVTHLITIHIIDYELLTIQGGGRGLHTSLLYI